MVSPDFGRSAGYAITDVEGGAVRRTGEEGQQALGGAATRAAMARGERARGGSERGQADRLRRPCDRGKGWQDGVSHVRRS